MTYQHGITVTETAATKRTITTVATAIIGLIAIAPAADAATFPLNKPVVVTNLLDAIEKAGETGTLRKSLQAIADQVRAPVIVVRVEPGIASQGVTIQQQTDLNVIGGVVAGQKTGIQALLAAEAQTGYRPRILGCPGLDAADSVKNALATVGQKLRAMAYGSITGAALADVIAARATFTQRELMLIHPDFLSPVDLAGTIGPSYAVARALGLRAKIDQELGWHKTLSNVPVAGVVGLTRDIGFDLQSVDSDANQLNAAHITTIVRINGDLRFWGSRTCAADASDYVFESATRTAHILADTMAAGLVEYIDKPLNPSLARDIFEDINAKFRALKRAGQVLGAVAYFDPDKNPVGSLKIGKLAISYRYTPVPPLESLGLSQEISDEFLADFAELVAGN